MFAIPEFRARIPTRRMGTNQIGTVFDFIGQDHKVCCLYHRIGYNNTQLYVKKDEDNERRKNKQRKGTER